MAKSKVATEEFEPDEAAVVADDGDDEPGDDWDSVEDVDVVVDDEEVEVLDVDELVIDDDEDEAEADATLEVEDGSDDQALDELEAEELEMLTDDEASETLVVDEAQELRAIRRAEIAMEADTGGGRTSDEFVCQSCFLVLKASQLADKRRQYCRDCAG